jgi:hypothetical protein
LVPQVWGRDDDGGGLTFKQQDIDQLVRMADHRGPLVAIFPMKEDYGRTILNLCVSDINKVRKTPSWPRSWANFSLL